MTNTDPHNEIQTIWQTQKSEPMNMSVKEIRLKANKFERRIRNRNLREYIAAAAVIVGFAVYIVIFPNPIVRAGCILIIAASLYVAYRLRRQGSAQTLSEDISFTSGVAHYRAELARQRNLLRSVMSWYIAPFIPGLIVFGVGLERMKSGLSAWLASAIPLFAIVFFVIWFLNRRGAKKLQREIDRLDALEK